MLTPLLMTRTSSMPVRERSPLKGRRGKDIIIITYYTSIARVKKQVNRQTNRTQHEPSTIPNIKKKTRRKKS
ncbi:hypothetical protein Y032_0476g2141 [Ancylostoma ceylanicum]|uniref:Uncharacterized protein n=1 Tax=Ancylostoma ceylanicum TaxID=53326 RepID=A0A016WXG1_9BILA|nr:hypothetical protein Y032_0476g2141 [Ancylostoma ceylanicum]